MRLTKKECLFISIRFKKNFLKFLIGVFCGILGIGIQNSLAQSESEQLMYTVKQGDSLIKIATNYGSPNFWEPIYEANQNRIANVDLIYPGQKLIIPPAVTESAKFMGNRVFELSPDTVETANQKTLDAFRKAFENVTMQEEKPARDRVPIYNGLEFGDLVINQTKSKAGKDFFYVFYQYWSAPENAGNFMISISEQPTPSMGTIISIKVDGQEIFKSRLQPRYDMIEELAKRAVAICYYYVRQHFSTSPELITY